MSFVDFLTEDIVHKAYPARDQWGEIGAPSSTTIKARVERSTRMIKNAKGEDVISTSRVWFMNRTIDHEDKITVDSVDRAIILIDRCPDKQGNIHHIKVELV